MAGPQPVAVDDDGDDDESDAVDQKLDELQEAEADAAAEAEQSESDDAPFESDEDIELDLADTNVGEEVDDSPSGSSGGSDDDPFEGTESSGFDGVDDDFGFDADDSGESGFDPTDGTLPSTLNEGAAKLAVLGLPEEFEHHGETKTKDELQDEFEEVFETFKLGDFGAEVADEYLFVEDDGVDPLVAFTLSLALCTIIVGMSRPDSDELVGKAKRRFSGMSGSIPGGI
jgi:hypothetical protein